MEPYFYTYYQSPIGHIKIGANNNVVTEVLFADSADFSQPGYELTSLLAVCVEQLIEYFNGNRKNFDIPVYQQGTTFQNSVWSELMNISYGKTISYLDLAKRLGNPKVIRAAASTNGKNNICIIVPCHRVVGSNNSLVGYAGGLSRKRWLLNHERSVEYGVQTLF